MKILMTGAGGFLGSGMVEPFARHGHTLRLLDVKPFSSRHEVMVADVSRYDECVRAVEGVEALVIAHVAGWRPDAYATPELCFDVNVKGTANLLFAAQEAGVRKAVVVSSTGAINHTVDPPWSHTAPLQGKGLYGLTKACQEMVAEHFVHEHGMQIASLRIGYVVDGDAMRDKYGRLVHERAPLDTDRRDVGEVARLALECEDLTYETLHVMSTVEAMDLWDVRYTCDRLGWTPRLDFDRLPLSPQFAKVT
ncbi:MAG: NAD(P)-dependent oxidoreductase [Planctomycetota bacterium]